MRPPAVIHVVTDRHRVAPDARTSTRILTAFAHWLDDVVAAAPDVIQVREPDLDARSLLAVVGRIVEATRGRPTRIVVNDRADVAVVARADGVHLRADGPPADRVRALVSAGWVVGRSAHSVAEVRAARGVDYVILGTIYASRSKPGVPGQGVSLVREAAADVTAVPIVAIGGINAARAAEVRAAGAAGVAAIGCFLPPSGQNAIGPGHAVAALREAMLE